MADAGQPGPMETEGPFSPACQKGSKPGIADYSRFHQAVFFGARIPLSRRYFMIYCYRCGVRLEEQTTTCPLCHTPVPVDAQASEAPLVPEAHWATGFPSHVGGPATQGPKTIPRGKELRQLLSLILLSPLLPMGLIWFIQEPGMPWILWAGGMLIGVWTILVPLGRLSRHPLPYSLVLLILTGGILLGIDGTIGPLDWSLEIALPISALIVLGYLLLRFLSKGFSDLGLPFLGGSFSARALLSRSPMG